MQANKGVPLTGGAPFYDIEFPVSQKPPDDTDHSFVFSVGALRGMCLFPLQKG